MLAGRALLVMARVAGWVLVGIAGLLALALAWFHTPPGRQMILDEIARFAPASGLTVEVGRLQGSVLWAATFSEVRFRDANGTLFLELDEADLSWRPWRWLVSGLDVRHLVVNGGTLHAVPELLPGDPDAPILPDFDIRVDRLLVADLRIAESVLGEERIVDLVASADVRSGRARVEARGELGGGDVLVALLDAMPDADRFDLEVDWQAPAGGLLATLAGLDQDLDIRLQGAGSWSRWNGTLLARLAGEERLNARLANRAGLYALAAEARPGGLLEDGILADALGEGVALRATGTLEASVFEGRFAVAGRGVSAAGEGRVNLAENAVEGLRLAGRLRDPRLFGEDVVLEGARFSGTLDGPLRDLRFAHEISIASANVSGTLLTKIRQAGTLTWNGESLRVPLSASVARVVSGQPQIDPRLVNGSLVGLLVLDGQRLAAEALVLRFPGINARLALASELGTGRSRLTGPVTLVRPLPVEGVGAVAGTARIDLALGGGTPWRLAAVLNGSLAGEEGGAIAALAGPRVQVAGAVALGEGLPVVVEGMRVTSELLQATVAGRYDGAGSTLSGEGRHADYGPFVINATLADDGPRATLLLASPLPAAGLENVRLTLAPGEDGAYAITGEGGSLLGAFSGEVLLRLAEGAAPLIEIARLDVAESRLTGTLALANGGVDGTLSVNRGGLSGRIALDPRAEGQGFAIDLAAREARFDGPSPIAIARGTLAASGVVGGEGTSLSGSARLQGLRIGSLFLGQLVARGQLADGVGNVDAALAGQRGSRFDLRLNAGITPERIGLIAQGSHAGRPITMPRRAILLALPDGGWQLEPTQLSYGGGHVVAQGRLGGDAPASGRLALARLPLDLLGAFADELVLTGSASGLVAFGEGANGQPVGDARLLLHGLSRAGTLVASRPLDIALVARLGEEAAELRAVLADGQGARGRLQGRIVLGAAHAGLGERLRQGAMAGQLRYRGPAASLWRLAGIELIDITGEAALVANASGSLAAPRLTGALAGDALRVRSALTGSDIRDVRARGRFAGTRLELTGFEGRAPNGGRINGSGVIDLEPLASLGGPRIDLRLAVRNAEVIDLPTMGATVTGPIRLVSDGAGGTIAGRLTVNAARWRLGAAQELAAALPQVAITETNLPPDTAARSGAVARPWRYLIDAVAADGIDVEGLGLESEWRGDLRLRGTTDDPRLGGEVQIVPRRGFYSFAGLRFDLTRGRIVFDQNGPIDPQLDILAEGSANGLAVAVTVTGTATRSQIDFSSQPALPQEELLARLLFGSSITQLSATDALQLGAAIASLQGGSGIDPINRLRNAVGLDRLRLVPADPALGRGTAVALGKNLTRRFYLELITDGAGYSATALEFRVTGWLSLLGSLTTIGRHSVAAEYRRDY